MYLIDESRDRETYLLLVPSMLDDHFPLLKYALYSREYRPVILENEAGITELGLKYVHNDMCYPCILNVGQMIAALQSGDFPLSRTRLLMPTIGDSCRGSNYISMLRKGLSAAGFGSVPVLSMNLNGMEKDSRVEIRPQMVWRALFAMFYGDLLMLQVNQTQPYELTPGAAEALRSRWFSRLSQDLKTGKHLTLRQLQKNFRLIARDFSHLPKAPAKKQRIGLIGDIFTKYCHIGNWDIQSFLEECGCETYVNGLSWYVLYYFDSHRPENNPLFSLGYHLVGRFVEKLQKEMLSALAEEGFYALPPLSVMKQEARKDVPLIPVGDGWLLGTEAVGMIRHQCTKVLAIHPFGCLPGHICGKGFYPTLNRRLSQGQIVTVDVDASSSRVSVYNRAKMLVDSR